MRRLDVALFALCTALAAAGAPAQGYPNKIIRMINPASPGGNSDILFRLLSPKMGELLGQQLVIDYRPGAGGIIGTELTARSARLISIRFDLRGARDFGPLRDFFFDEAAELLG